MTNELSPQIAKVVALRKETPDVKTFTIRGEKGLPFTYMPGQCAMVSLPSVGEAMFSITSSPTQADMEFSIKRVGLLTEALHKLAPGQAVGVRGPYGNGFPVEMLKGKDLLFIGGGIGLAPLRSLINYCLDNRADYGQVDIIYGARSPQDLVFTDELFERWPKIEGVQVRTTVDVGDETWNGPVGVVTKLLEELNPDPQGRIAITCGPPIMIKFVLLTLAKLGYSDDQIITTLEKRMKCGIGKCGRCNIGGKYICVDGPVFTLAQLRELPDEL